MNDIGSVLKRLRLTYHLTQEQVAGYLGIPQQTYSNYERNAREIPVVCVVALAKMYRVSTDCILGMPPRRNVRCDLTAAFSQNVSLETVLLCMQDLDKKNRLEALRFLSYLSSAQYPGKQDRGRDQ